MNKLLELINSVIVSGRDKVTNSISGFPVLHIMTIIRQYASIFNSLRIGYTQNKNVLIILPNGMELIFLVLISMLKRLKVYVLSYNESLTNIKHIILLENIQVLITDEKKVKEFENTYNQSIKDIFSFVFNLKTIFHPGYIFNGNVILQKVFYTTDPVHTTKNLVKFANASQYQEMEHSSFVEWYNKQSVNDFSLITFNNISDSTQNLEYYEVLSTLRFNRGTMSVLEKKVQLLINNLKLNTGRISLNLDYAKFMPLVVSIFSVDFEIERDLTKSDIHVFDSKSFMNMWRRIISLNIYSTFWYKLYSISTFLYILYIRKRFKKRLGSFKNLIIIDDGSLPLTIKRLISKLRLPISIVTGVPENNYLSLWNTSNFHNTSGQLIDDFREIINQDKEEIEFCDNLYLDKIEIFPNSNPNWVRYPKISRLGDTPKLNFDFYTTSFIAIPEEKLHRSWLDIILGKTRFKKESNFLVIGSIRDIEGIAMDEEGVVLESLYKSLITEIEPSCEINKLYIMRQNRSSVPHKVLSVNVSDTFKSTKDYENLLNKINKSLPDQLKLTTIVA